MVVYFHVTSSLSSNLSTKKLQISHPFNAHSSSVSVVISIHVIIDQSITGITIIERLP